ncbi:MAG: ester cyclase [Candidatus Promineifilaceae bacterium]
MFEERNVEIARRWFENLWSQGQLDVADEIVDPEYAPEWVQIDATGPGQVKHEVRYFRSVFPDLVYEIVDIVGLEDRVWVRYRGSGTHDGSAWGFEPTGKQVTFEGATILFINSEGKIIDRWGAFCFYDIFADLGLVPPFWELSQNLVQGN